MYRFDDLDPFETRRAKLAALQEAGLSFYPSKSRFTCLSVIEARQKEETTVLAVEGRITSLRLQGALFFVDIRDRTGKIQLLFKKDELGEKRFEVLNLLDLGDFIAVLGSLFYTKRGELTLGVHDIEILVKALRPLPDQWKGLQDIEQRERQRYAELLVNEQTKERFLKRSQLIGEVRQFLVDKQFLEVETPILEHIPGGADAEPFVTHHQALDVDFYLRISLELHLKRLVVGGLERVFELGRVFRNEGLSPQHLQEFTMLEFYWAYADYHDLMEMVEQLYQAIIERTFGSLQISRGENILDFAGTWPRVSYVELLKQHAGIDVLQASDEELVACIKKYRLDTNVSLGRGRLLDQLYKKTVRPKLIQPQFVIDIPVEFSPLAKRKVEDPRLTERFLVLVDGAELGNGFSELNDPLDQRARLEEQEKLRLKGDKEAQRLDEDFLRALEYGMPPTAGFGVGIDRLLTVLLDVNSIRETVFFPTMRPEKIEN
jgi:lysyl-tRNA synthetase class 2